MSKPSAKRNPNRNNPRQARREPPRGRGFAIALIVILVLTAVGTITAPSGAPGRFGKMVRYEATTFSVKVPESFMERSGAKEIEKGVERRSYNGLGESSQQPVHIQVMTSNKVDGDVESLARGLAKNIAEQTKGDFKELKVLDSELKAGDAREIRFAFTSNTGVASRGVIAYGRTKNGRDVSVLFLYPAADATSLEGELLKKVIRSVELS